MTTRHAMRARRTRVALAVATTIGAGIVAVASPSSATVTAVRGSAFGYHAFNISLFGGAQDEIGPRPIVTLAPDASNSPQTATEEDVLCPGGECPRVQFGPAVIWSAERATVSTSGSLGPTGSVTSTTDLQDLNTSRVEIFGEDNYDCCIPVGQEEAGNVYNRLAPPSGSGIAPQPARPLTDVGSTCTASETGVTGSTTVTNGWLYLDSGWADSDTVYPEPAEPGPGQVAEHDPVKVVVPTNPAPNTTYAGHLHVARNATDNYVLVFNEQILNPDGSLTVNAIHYYFGYRLENGVRVVDQASILKGELIVGQVVCGVATGVTTTTTLPTTTSTSTTTTLPTTTSTSTSTTLPPTGPAVVSGSTWYSDGSRTKSGPAGTQVQAYAVGALQNVPYRLVLGTGAGDRACASIVATLNQATLFAGPSRLLGRTTGTIPTGLTPGTYKLCFEDSSTGNLTGTGGATFTVQ